MSKVAAATFDSGQSQKLSKVNAFEKGPHFQVDQGLILEILERERPKILKSKSKVPAGGRKLVSVRRRYAAQGRPHLGFSMNQECTQACRHHSVKVSGTQKRSPGPRQHEGKRLSA